MKEKDSRPTVIFVHPHFTLPGGAGKVILELGERLADRYQIHIVAQTVWPQYVECYPHITFHSLNGPTTGKVGFWARLPHWYRQTAREISAIRSSAEGKVVLFCNVFPANWLGLWYAKHHPELKTIWFCHEPSAFIHIKSWQNAISNPVVRIGVKTLAPILAILDKDLVKAAQIILVNSQYGLERMRAVYGRDGVVVYPGVDSKRFKAIPVPERQKQIMTVGRLTGFKRVDVLVRAFAKLTDTEYRLVIVGDGEEKVALQNLIDELGISSRVDIRSGLDDTTLDQVYAQSRLFVLASQKEPFGIVALEALAAGVPVIADNSGGPQEIVENGVCGCLIDCQEDELATTLQDLLRDEKKLIAYAKAARERAVTRFNWERSADDVASIL